MSIIKIVFVSLVAVCAIVLLLAGFNIIISEMRRPYKYYKKTVTSGKYSCLTYEVLTSVWEISGKFEVYGSNVCDIIYHANERDYSVLLSYKDYKRFSKWYDKLLESKKQRKIDGNMTYKVLEEVQKDIERALRDAQRSVLTAGRNCINIANRIEGEKNEQTVRYKIDCDSMFE